MPKGKPRKTNPDLYAESSTPRGPSTAPQAAPHRRGGTHKVKDEDLTGTVFDTWNYTQLVEAAKDRKLHYKDMKKADMIHALAKDYHRRQIEERIAAKEHSKRIQERKNEEERKVKAQQEQIAAKRLEKARRQARNESVSDDSMDDSSAKGDHDRNDYTVPFGQALSDCTTSSTSSESTVLAATGEIHYVSRLRLFECTDAYNPPLTPFGKVYSGRPLPWICHYAPLKVITVHSKQKVVLPGQKPFLQETGPVRPKQKYEIQPGPDYAPALSLEERVAARNGVLQGTLGHAVIERGTEWARHTQVRGSDAMMLFKLPPRDESRNLADVYRKWSLEKRKLLRVKRVDRNRKERAWRHEQIRRNRGRRTAEVFQVSCYRPQAMGYLPVFLDFDFRKKKARHIENNCSLENLFYIRFPACDLPHFYFWTQDGDWADPTIPNPSWSPDMVPQKQITEVTRMVPQEQAIEVTDDEELFTKKSSRRWIRYKRPNITVSDLNDPSSPTTDFTSKLTKIERELYTNGLAPTLHDYRKKWAAKGKERAWKIFARNLRELYPNGELPDAPPVLIEDDGATVAFKLAVIDDLEDVEYPLLSPLRGDEGWTRHDDEYWSVIDLGTDEDPQEKIDLSDIDEEIEDIHTSGKEQALYRRSSVPFYKIPRDWDAWLNQISLLSSPTPMTLIKSPTDDNWTSRVNQEWEEKFLRPDRPKTSHFCPVCCINWITMSTQAQTQHILSHSTNGQARHRQATTKRPSPLMLPPFTQNSSRFVFNHTFYDAGVDGDLDTPIKPTSRNRVKAKPKARPRSSARAFALDANQSHVHSPSLQFLDHVLSRRSRKISLRNRNRPSGSGHVQSGLELLTERWVKRKQGNEDNNNSLYHLSFLDSYRGIQKKRRRMVGRSK